MTITPGSQYSIVIGKGGSGVSVHSADTSYKIGNYGSQTTAFGKRAEGGQGGNYTTSVSSSVYALGGQNSDGLSNIRKVPVGGEMRIVSLSGTGSSYIMNPLECFNVFELKRFLAAGGSIYSTSSSQYSYYQDNDPDFPEYISNSVRAETEENVSSPNAVGPGCGSGACVVRYVSSAHFELTLSTGNAADGACYIYVAPLLFASS